MPLPDPRTGNICIWLISCFFFVALTTGGIFLVLYISHPSAESSSWFPVAGVVLVALPWLFWILTCLYRCISRACFGRGSDGAGGGGAGVGVRPQNGANGGNAVNSRQMPRTASGSKNSMEESTELQVESPDDNGRRVRFGATVVVDESNGGGSSGRGDDDDDPKILDSSGVLNGAYDDTSFASHESEMPLASSRLS